MYRYFLKDLVFVIFFEAKNYHILYRKVERLYLIYRRCKMQKLISLKELGIDNLGVTFIKPPHCNCCGSENGECSEFIFKNNDEIFNAMSKILEDLKSTNCIGFTFKENREVLIEDKLLNTSKVVQLKDIFPRLQYLIQVLNFEFIVIFVEVKKDTFKVLHSNNNKYILNTNIRFRTLQKTLQ